MKTNSALIDDCIYSKNFKKEIEKIIRIKDKTNSKG